MDDMTLSDIYKLARSSRFSRSSSPAVNTIFGSICFLCADTITVGSSIFSDLDFWKRNYFFIRIFCILSIYFSSQILFFIFMIRHWKVNHIDKFCEYCDDSIMVYKRITAVCESRSIRVLVLIKWILSVRYNIGLLGIFPYKESTWVFLPLNESIWDIDREIARIER